MIILSILIPTIPTRGDMFTRLYNEIYRQMTYVATTHPALGKVEVLVDDTKRYLDGGLSIGKKREALVKRAEGKYLCFLDDDEWIAPNYIETLVRACLHNADVITFKNISKMDTYWTIVDMSLFYPNDQTSPVHTTRRRPWHICPVRSEYAKQFVFHDINYGEDFSWMEKVLTLCTTETKLNGVLHEYRHSKLISESDKIVNHELLSKQ